MRKMCPLLLSFVGYIIKMKGDRMRDAVDAEKLEGHSVQLGCH